MNNNVNDKATGFLSQVLVGVVVGLVVATIVQKE